MPKTPLELMKEEFPEEFSKGPLTLKQQLKEIDQIMAIEQNFLDNPDPRGFNSTEEIPNEIRGRASAMAKGSNPDES